MKKTLISAAIAALFAGSMAVRARTLDVSYTYRMGAGFAGDVNRTHPVSILPALQSAAQPVRAYGDPGIYDGATSAIRGFQAGDTAVTRIAGVVARPYPVQQTSGGMNAGLNVADAAPANPAVLDVVEDGYILVRCSSFAANPPAKDGAVFVWCAASAGNDVQGSFRAAASAGNTAAIANARWNGPADANGIAELVVWKA